MDDHASKDPAAKAGGFVWYELMTSDVEAAQAFYGKVVGWTMADSGMPGMRYTIATVGKRPVAGLMGFPPDRGTGPVMWFGYIAVADVDAMAERVRGAGGAVHRPPTDIPGVGRFAVVADPQGAMFMLFRGAGQPAADLAPNTPGAIGWHELRATDWQTAFPFYRDLFGWETAYAHDMGPMGVYQTFSVGGAWTGGMMTATQAPVPIWTYYITVEDIDAAAARVVDAGGSVLSGPHPVPGDAWVLMGLDPQGARFALTGGRKGAG